MANSSNTVVLSMSTPGGMLNESVTVPANSAVIGLHIIRFANQHGISAAMVRHCTLPAWNNIPVMLRKQAD
jgi:hypothetical protein